ncbi:DUF3153 domain-containing protein [Oculatella sp. LEGE 06141]|nr:DUF3153 domain-containing protein [Oculatella sp. LEGE 06141]
MRLLVKLRLLWIIAIAFLFLSGCVQYDVGIHYASQTRGEIVQQIQVSDRLTTFSGSVVQDWLKSIERRTRQLGGKTRRTGDQSLTITIPFNNGKDLEAKFNTFFQPTPSEARSVSEAGIELPEIESTLHLQESNFLLLQRNRLVYDLDLRSLGVLSANGNLLVSPGSLLELNFSLNTPWGARSPATANTLQPVQQGNQLVWILQAGQANHVEAVFWVPSPLGIGTAVILLLVVAGAFLKTQLAPTLAEGGEVALSESR